MSALKGVTFAKQWQALLIRYWLFVIGKKQNPRTTNYELRTTNQPGFTLIELMVTIAIIGIISTVGLISYSKAQSLGRDARRKQDLASLAIALELYYQKNKTHPPPTAIRDYNAGADGCVSSMLPGYLEPDFTNKVLEDPLRKNYGGFNPSEIDWCYWYYKGDPIANRKTYTLYARLENQLPANDPNVCKPQQLYRAELSKFNYCFSP